MKCDDYSVFWNIFYYLVKNLEQNVRSEDFYLKTEISSLGQEERSLCQDGSF